MSDVTGSKRKAFRHVIRLVQISELQKDETATTRVFRTPTSMWEYQTSFITRIRQHAFCPLAPKAYSSQPASKDPVRYSSSSTFSEMFDELVSATPFAAFRRTYLRLMKQLPLLLGAHSHRFVQA